MSKRYIVAVGSSTKEQTEAFLEFIRSNGLGWWHWVEHFWLITDIRERFSAGDIRDELNKTHPKITKLVIELRDDGDTWAGHGPSSEKRNMFDWLNETWEK